VDGLKIAVTSTDPIYPVTNDCVNKSAQKPVESALGLILAQRSLFPVHPPPRGSTACRLASKRLADVEWEDLPDMGFFTSKLAPGSAKCVSGRVFVNPGVAAKESGWGTLAEVHLSPSDGGVEKMVGVDFIKL
jgi:hypothetical protein